MEFPKIDLDVHDFKKEVKLELCTPAKKGIAELTEAYGVHLSIKAMMLAELSFNLPTKVDRYGELIDNPNIVNMRPYYLVRLSIGKDFKQYFRIAKPKAEATGDEDFNSYACRSYEVILSDRQLLSYSVVSYAIDEILNGNVSEGMNGILADTNWTVGYMSTEFTSMRRSVDSGNTNKLDFILNNLSKAYNCIPIFDTVNNEINIYSNTEIGEDLGLTFSYRKYIEAFGLEYDTDEFTSRLRAVGKDGISLHEVTPTGQPYLENFAYFMQGFERYPTTLRHEHTKEDFQKGELTNIEATNDDTLKLVDGETDGCRIWPELDLSDTKIAQGSVINYREENTNMFYCDGKEFVEFVEGYSEGSGAQSKEDDHLYLEVDRVGNIEAVRIFVTDVPIDFTDIDWVFIDWESQVNSELMASVVLEDDKMGWVRSIACHKWGKFSRTITKINTKPKTGLKYLKVVAYEWGNVGLPASKLNVYRIGIGDGTSVKWINVESSIDSGVSWQPVVNNSAIPGIEKGDDLSDKKVLVKTEMYSSDPNDSPELCDLFVAVRGKETSSSNYFSDELCHAQLDYEELLILYEGRFNEYLDNKKALRVVYGEKETELFDITTDLHKITDRLYALQDIDNSYHFNELTYDGTAVSKTFTLNSEYKYMVMANVSKTVNLTLKLDGTTIPMTANVWKFLGKVDDEDSITVGLSGSATNVDVTIIVVKIMDEEYNESGNEEYLIERYCEPKKEHEYNDRFAEMVGIIDQVDLIDSDIEQLRMDLSLDANFGSLIEERNSFIIEKTFENNNITDAEDLLKEARDKFLEVNSPALVLDLNSVNFLDIISDEAYYDKDKIFRTALNSGVYDWATVNYEPFNVSLKCMILEIDLDVENSNLRFTFSNVREILSDDERRMRDLYKASTSAMSYLREKFKYDEAFTQANLIRDLLDSEWDAATRSLRGGTNLSVEFGKFGIKITDPDNPLRVIQLNDSYIGISVDGGNTFKSVISAEGIAARRLIGEIVLAAQLHIVNAGGNISFTEDGMQVFDQLGKLRLHIGNIDVSENRYGLRLLDSTGTQSILDDRGMLQSWSDSMADNVDSTHNLVMKFYIPEEAISIRRLKLNFSLEAFRAYSTGAASGGGKTTSFQSIQTSSGGTSHSHNISTLTSSSTGSHSHDISGQTASATGSHYHTWGNYISNTPGNYTKRLYKTWNNVTQAGVNFNLETSSAAGLATADTGQHSHSVTGATSDSTGSHSHTVSATTSEAESAHTHTVPGHEHSVPDHEHDITYGIYESTTATGVDVYVNGTKRLGSYSTNQNDLDLTQWITEGWNEIQLSSTRLGRINCSYFAQVFLGI